MSFWDYLYGTPEPARPTDTFWDFMYGEEDEDEVQRERQRRYAEEIASRAPAPLSNQATAQRGEVGAGYIDELMGPPEPAFTTPQMERITQPPLSATASQSPVAELGQDLQSEWQKRMQELDAFQQRAQEQQMMAPPIPVEVERPERIAPPVMGPVDHGPIPPGASRLADMNMTIPQTVPEGRIVHDEQGLTERRPTLVQKLEDLRIAGDSGFLENLHQTGIGLTWAGLQAAQALADLPTRVMMAAATGGFIGGDITKADEALEVLLREEPTNPVAAFIGDLKRGVEEYNPPEGTRESLSRMFGTFVGIAAEYALGGRAIREALGIPRHVKTAKVGYELARMQDETTGLMALARRARLRSQASLREAVYNAGANVASYGPLDVTQVMTGDASLPHLLDLADSMEQGDKVPQLFRDLNESPGGRALFELGLGSLLDVPLEGVAGARHVGREVKAARGADMAGAHLADARGIPLQEVEPRVPGEGQLDLMAEPVRDMQAVEEAFQAREGAKRDIGASLEQAAQRGKAALERMVDRYSQLTREMASTARSVGSEMEVFFDPALRRDMGIWGGAVIARAKGNVGRLEWEETLKARFPAITDNVLDQAWNESQKVYREYLRKNASMKGKEWSELEPDGITERTYTMSDELVDAEDFGSLAEAAAKQGIEVGGHRWYREGLLPWLTNVLGDEDQARLYLAVYSATSSGQSAGGGNITLANQAFGRWKAGDVIYDPEEGVFLGYRGWSVARNLDKVFEAFRLAQDPGSGLNSIKYRNFYEALSGKDRTVVDLWMQRVYGYDYWKSPTKVQTDRATGQLKTEKVTPGFTQKQYEFVAADVDRIAWEMRPGGQLEDLGRMVGNVGEEGAERSAVQAAIWVGAQIMKQGKASDDAMPAVELLARRLDDLVALRGSDEFTLQNVARKGWADAGAAHIGALAYLSNTTAGALTGLAVGDTWEDRIQNSLKLALGGALGTKVAAGWIRTLKANGGLKDAISLLWSNPVPVQKIPVAVEPGIRIPPTGDLGQQVARLRATHTAVTDAVQDLATTLGLKNMPDVRARTRSPARIREGGLELGGDFEVGMNIVMPREATDASGKAVLALASDLMDQRGGFHYRLRPEGSGQAVALEFRTKPSSADIQELGETVKLIARERGFGDEYLGFSLDGKRMVSVNGTDIPDREFLDILDEAGERYGRDRPYTQRVKDATDLRSDHEFIEPEGGWREELVRALEEAGGDRRQAEETAVRLLERHGPRTRQRAEEAAARGKPPSGVAQYAREVAEQFSPGFTRESVAGAAVGGAVGATEGGDVESAVKGALIGGAAGLGGSKLLRNTKIGRRMGWDQRGAIGDLSSFKDLPHKLRTEFMRRLARDDRLVQDWLSEIELQNLDDNLEELVALRNLGQTTLSDMPRLGQQVSTNARKRIQAGLRQANEYINELWDQPMTSEELRMLDQGKVRDVKPAYFIEGHPPFEGYNHSAARKAAQYKTGLSIAELGKQGTDGFTFRLGGERKFLSRGHTTRLLRDRGALAPKGTRRPSAFGEEGFSNVEILRGFRDIAGGALAGGAVGGSMDTDNRAVGAGVGAAIGAGLGYGTVKGRLMREEGLGLAAGRAKEIPPTVGSALEQALEKGEITIRRFKTPDNLRQWVAAQKGARMNASETAAWIPEKQTVAVLRDEVARETTGLRERDLISQLLSIEDVDRTLRYKPQEGEKALQEARRALALEGGYKAQSEASGVPESVLRLVDRMERLESIPERQLQREALAAKLAAERATRGTTSKLGGSIRTRKGFQSFLGDIQKFNIVNQGAEKRLQGIWEAHREAEGLQKTVKHDAQVRKEVEAIVREMGLDPDSKAMDLRPGTTYQQALAIRDIVARNAEDLEKIGQYARENVLSKDEQEILAAHTGALHKQILDMLDRLAKTRTEAGRQLRAFRLVAERNFDPSNRSTFYLMAQNRHPQGHLTEPMRAEIDRLLAEGDKDGLVNFLSNLSPSPPARQVIRLWKAMLLTSPKTHMRNNLGNWAMATLEEVKDVPAYIADRMAMLVAKRLGHQTQATKALKNLRDVSRAGRNGAVEGARDFARVIRGQDPEMALREVQEKLDLIGDVKIDNSYLEAAASLSFRSLSAEDKFWRGIAKARSMLDQASTMARNEGRAGKKSRQWMRDRARYLIDNPSDEMLMRAEEDAAFAVFQNSNRVARWINKGKKIPGFGPVFEYLMPFVNTPMNIAARMYDYSPGGAVMASRRLMQLLRKAKITGVADPKLQREFSEMAGRASVGTLAILGGYILFKQDKMRVSYPDTPSEREKWKLTGEQDGSILVDGKWRNIRQVSPLGNLLLIGGAVAQLEDDPEINNWLAVAEGGVGAGIEQFKEMPMLTGMSTFSRAIDNWDYEAGRMGRNMARSFVPSIVRDMSRAMDRTLRETKGGGPITAVQGSTPGASRNLPPKVDVLGRELTRDQGPVGSFFDLFNSRADRRNTTDPVARALLDLNVNVGPRQRIGGETDWQYYRRAKAQGEDLYRRIRAEVESEGFRSLTPEEQADHLRSRIGVWRRRMTEAWDDAHPDYP
jgi:hypothetical protein